MSNDWTQTPPPVPDGMPDGTEWCEVKVAGPPESRFWVVKQLNKEALPWSWTIQRGLTALAFPMPDGTDEKPSWRIEPEYLKPVMWLEDADGGTWMDGLWCMPDTGTTGNWVSARWALMVPPRVYGGQNDADADLA